MYTPTICKRPPKNSHGQLPSHSLDQSNKLPLPPMHSNLPANPFSVLRTAHAARKHHNLQLEPACTP